MTFEDKDKTEKENNIILKKNKNFSNILKAWQRSKSTRSIGIFIIILILLISFLEKLKEVTEPKKKGIIKNLKVLKSIFILTNYKLEKKQSY